MQLPLVGEADSYRLLTADNTSCGGAEGFFRPSIWKEVIKVPSGHNKSVSTTTKTPKEVVKDISIHRDFDGSAPSVSFLRGGSNWKSLSNLANKVIKDAFFS